MAVPAAEADVRNRLRHEDFPEPPAIGGNAMHAVARRGPEIAVLVHAHAVRATGRNGMENVAARQAPVGRHVEGADVARIVRVDAPGIGDVEARFIRTEGKAVRAVEIGQHGADMARMRIDAVDIAGQRLLAARALVIRSDAVVRIGEPDRTVRGDDDVVGRVQRLAIVTVGDHGDGAIVLRTRDAARAVFAGHEAAFPVARVAVGKIRRLAECRDAERGAPAQHAVVGNVGEQQAIVIAEPDRPLGPVEPAGKLLERRIAQHETGKDGLFGLKKRHPRLPCDGNAFNGNDRARLARAGIGTEQEATAALHHRFSHPA